jgi:hypothetical protein
MKTNLENIALERFFEFYKNDIESEIIDPDNVVISFPVHFSGFHRVEVTVTRVSEDQYIISDGAKILDELRSAGYVVNAKLHKRIEDISKVAGIRVVKGYLVSDSDLASLGSSIQRFLEAAKTIGDAYLVQKTSSPKDTQILKQVSEFLAEQHVPFQTRHPLMGQFEKHVVDFYFPPNGVPGLALSVMNNPSRTVAEAWAFRSMDIKKNNERMRVGVVYDDQEVRDNSKTILSNVLDVSIPSSKITQLSGSLKRLGIIH